MIKNTERVIPVMLSAPFAVVRDGFIARARIESGRRRGMEAEMVGRGFEQVDADLGSLVSSDGREVMWVNGIAWALRPDIHAERLAVAFAASKKEQPPEPETKSVAGTESLSAMVCPKCGDMLQHTRVCPACPAGKLGYRHRYTCACGGVDLVSKESL